MADVNKNIIDAYRSMYESKEEVLDETNKNDKSDDGEGLDAVQPKAVMKIGFTLTSTLDGRIITHAKLLKENDFLKIQWQDDSHTIRIESENDK